MSEHRAVPGHQPHSETLCSGCAYGWIDGQNKDGQPDCDGLGVCWAKSLIVTVGGNPAREVN